MTVEVGRDQLPFSEPDNVPTERDETLNRLIRAGLYTRKGCSTPMKLWIKERDNFRCQFAEFNAFRGWEQCSREEDPELTGVDLKRVRNRQRWQLEVHHIYPQSMMASHPVKHGGEQPTNLITLCAGLAGETGHHDLMQPTMIIAKMTYATDHTSYDKWIKFAHAASEQGLSLYNFEWDGMMKMIAKSKTVDFIRRSGKQFPYAKEQT